MIIRCTSNLGKNLSPHYRGIYRTEETLFDVTVDRNYVCHAMALFNGGLIALVRDDNNSPGWYPIDLFEIVDDSISGSWKIGLRDEGEGGLQAIIGYPEIVTDQEHYLALMERLPAALQVFEIRAAPKFGDDGS